MDAVFTNGSVASGLGVTKMADLSKEGILQAITDQDLRFLAVRVSVCLQKTFLEHFYKTLSFPTDGSIFTRK